MEERRRARYVVGAAVAVLVFAELVLLFDDVSRALSFLIWFGLPALLVIGLGVQWWLDRASASRTDDVADQQRQPTPNVLQRDAERPRPVRSGPIGRVERQWYRLTRHERAGFALAFLAATLMFFSAFLDGTDVGEIVATFVTWPMAILAVAAVLALRLRYRRQ